jgi:subfamily B ATP-binding cassette protein HlyB/CyaB
VFIIAHRLSTVRMCDRIVVMDKGRVVEQGNHDQLIKHNGYYARLHRYQSTPPSLRDTSPTSQGRTKVSPYGIGGVARSAEGVRDEEEIK